MKQKTLEMAKHLASANSLQGRPVHFTVHQGLENLRVRLRDEAF